MKGDKINGLGYEPGFKGRDFISIHDFNPDRLPTYSVCTRLKKMQQEGKPHPVLAGKTLGMLFQKPSTRTRYRSEWAYTSWEDTRSF